jgi:hypothetical protein
MGSRSWFPYAALALAFAMGATAFSTAPFVQNLLLLLSALCGVAVGAHVLAGKRSARYDLGVLREVHEREEALEIELDEPQEFDSVHCLHCDTVYSSRLPACPQCGRR